MTEDEAKTKWCPMVRLVYYSGPTNRRGDSNRCLGPECMMWRATDDECRLSDESLPEVLPAGYCGLAGKP